MRSDSILGAMLSGGIISDETPRGINR